MASSFLFQTKMPSFGSFACGAFVTKKASKDEKLPIHGNGDVRGYFLNITATILLVFGMILGEHH